MKRVLPFLFLTIFLSFVARGQNIQKVDYGLTTSLINSNREAIGLSEADLKNTLINASYEDGSSGIRYTYLQQTYKGIPIDKQILVLTFRQGKLLSKSGYINPSAEKIINNKSATPSLSAITAVGAALSNKGFSPTESSRVISSNSTASELEFNAMGVSRENITAKLMWTPIEEMVEGKLRQTELKLSWQVYFIPKTNSDYWLLNIDAASGKVIAEDNLTDYDNYGEINPSYKDNIVSSNIIHPSVPTFKLFNKKDDTKLYNSPSVVNGASYRVVPFPAESPWAPGGSFAIRTNPWTAAPGNATTLKWHTGAAAADYDYSRGNNSWAYEDRTAPTNTGTIAKSAQSTTSPDPLTFNFVPDTTVNPIQTTPIQNQQFNITNLFYWTNIIHDVMYQYGFNEVSGNFQDDNLGRGGAGNDHVNGEAQDASGTNNANFSTPADGGSGRMQMFLWNLGGASPNKDGDADNGIVVHEFGHGISNRLTGGPAQAGCLGNAEQMGEGWSDYYSLMFTQDWAGSNVNTGFNSPRGIGLYALNGSNLFSSPPGTGIRHFKYCTNFAINSQVYLANLPSSPHDRGEIWCATLWEMTWEIIKSTGTIEPNIYNASSLAGNVVAFRLVTEGLKLQQCSPGFISGRNAIIQADQNLYAGAHICAIKKAFAKRGMGDLASEGSTNSISDQVVDFTNGVAALTMVQNGAAGIPEGQNIVYTHTLSANACDPIVNYTLRDTLPANVTFVSAPGGVYNNGTRVVSWNVNLATGTSVVYNLTVNINAGSYFPPLILINEPVASTTISPFWTAASTTANVWTAHNVRSNSAPNSFFTPNAGIVSDQTLATTASFAIGATPPVLSFWHQYQTESTFDGGVLEISLNGGTSWADIGETNMLQNPYNATISTAFLNPLAGRRAWSGTASSFVETRVNMVPYANQANVKLRWRLGSDNSVAAIGWNVDDINLKTVAVVNLRSNLFNASNVRESFVDTVTVILPPVGGTPVAMATPASQTVCTGTAITTIVLTSDIAGTTYAWTRDNTGVVTGIAATGTGNISGTLVNTTAAPVTVTFTITPTAGGNVGLPITATVTVNPGLIVDQPANQTVCNGANTLPVNFTGSPSTNFNWTNNTTSIGLAASGTGNIPAFAAVNTGSAPVVATISVTPVPAPTTFTNASPILIPGVGTTGPGSPYPSNIVVTGITGTVSKVTVKLNNLNHTFPDDIDILLVGPGGQNAIIMSDVGGGADAVNLSFTLDDAATASLPDSGPLVPGTFKPTNIGAGDPFAAPAPAPSGNVPLSIFNGTNPNGTWSLYIVDDVSGDIGSLSTGWDLNIFTASAGCPATPKDFTITVNPTPVVDAVPNQSLCSGSNTTAVNFTSPTTGGTVTYNWTNSDSTIGLAASGSGNIAAFTTTNATSSPVIATITVTPSYSNGGTTCTRLPITFTITVNPTASVNQPLSQTVCNNSTTLPVNFTGTANTTFNWTNSTTSIGLGANGTGNIASFTATNATNAPVTATVTVNPVFTTGGGGPVTQNFASTVLVNIPALPTTSGPASPYPTNIVVSGVSNPITKVTVKLNGLNHTFPDDIDILLVGPGGQNAIILSDVGGSLDVVDVNLVLDDAAVAPLSDAGQLVSGTYQPTNIGTGDPFAAPAPTPSGNVPLSIFNGTAANGVWSLYIIDDLGGDFGTLSGGWELNITSTAPAACPATPKTFTITVNPTPKVNAVANQTFCNGNSTTAINFTSPSTGGTLSYSWTNSNTSIGLGANGIGNIPVFTATNSGTAPVSGTITVTPSFTNGGTTCTGTAITFTITINPTPTVNAVANQTVCKGQSTAAVTFSGAVPGTVYTWVNNNTATGLGASGTGNIPSFVATNTTTVPITSTITVTPNFGTSPTICSGTPITFTITVNPLPVVTCPGNITVTSTLGLCTAPVTYNAIVTGTPTPVVTYTFSGATTASGSGTGTGSLFNVGVTTVTITASNSCASSTCSFTVTIIDAQLPVISSQPVTKTVCESANATFSVTATNALSYQWEFFNGSTWVAVPGATGATYTINNVAQNMNTNTFRVRVIGLCTTVTSNNATLFVDPKPAVSIISTQTVLVPGSTFTLTAVTNTTGGSFIWYRNGVVVPGVTGNILSGGRIDDRATYKVTYTNLNGCTNTSADFTVGTLQTTTIYVYPNPNNGQFQIRFYNLPNEAATVYIYNAAGQIVFNQKIPTGTLPYSQMAVNISNMAAGMYVIKLINGAGQELGNTRIIKQ